MTTTSRVGEPDSAPGDLNALEATLKNATKKPYSAAATGKKADEPATVQKPDYIADKFWTGNLEESLRKQAEAYGPLQSAYGRMANDLGTQRKITDQILALDKRQTDLEGNPTTAKKPPVVNPRALVDNPTETLDAYWRTREAEAQAAQEARDAKAAQAAAEQAFLIKHSDFNAVTADPKFSQWVHSSPLRVRASALAAQGNFVVADELLTEYKALQGQAPNPAADPNRGKQQTAAEIEAARRAGLENAAQAGGGQGKSGPVYRRADLIQLKMEKPHVYSDPAFQAEILRAYAEGRVK
jgi:hypothetical protein